MPRQASSFLLTSTPLTRTPAEGVGPRLEPLKRALPPTSADRKSTIPSPQREPRQPRKPGKLYGCRVPASERHDKVRLRLAAFQPWPPVCGRGNKNEIRKELACAAKKTRQVVGRSHRQPSSKYPGWARESIPPVTAWIKAWPPNGRTVLATLSLRPEASSRRDDPFRKVPVSSPGRRQSMGTFNDLGAFSPARADLFTVAQPSGTGLASELACRPPRLSPPVCPMPRIHLLGPRRKAFLNF